MHFSCDEIFGKLHRRKSLKNGPMCPTKQRQRRWAQNRKFIKTIGKIGVWRNPSFFSQCRLEPEIEENWIFARVPKLKFYYRFNKITPAAEKIDRVSFRHFSLFICVLFQNLRNRNSQQIGDQHGSLYMHNLGFWKICMPLIKQMPKNSIVAYVTNSWSRLHPAYTKEAIVWSCAYGTNLAREEELSHCMSPCPIPRFSHSFLSPKTKRANRILWKYQNQDFASN